MPANLRIKRKAKINSNKTGNEKGNVTKDKSCLK